MLFLCDILATEHKPTPTLRTPDQIIGNQIMIQYVCKVNLLQIVASFELLVC